MDVLIALHDDPDLFRGGSALGIVAVVFLLVVLFSGGRGGDA